MFSWYKYLIVVCFFPPRFLEWESFSDLLSYLNLIKYMKTYIRRQQHKNVFKHQDIKQKEPPQEYRIGTIRKAISDLNLIY